MVYVRGKYVKYVLYDGNRTSSDERKPNYSMFNIKIHIVHALLWYNLGSNTRAHSGHYIVSVITFAVQRLFGLCYKYT